METLKDILWPVVVVGGLGAFESNLEFIIGQLAQVPSRKQLARYSLVMVGTACLVQTLALLFR